MSESVRVLFSCTGVELFNRGIESFFRECFDGLKETEGLEALLVKGAGEPKTGEVPVWCLPRTKCLARLVGKLTGRSSYAAEQWSSFPAVVRQIRRFRPHLVFYSDANLGFLLHRFRRHIGYPFGLLFSNGGPCSPPFTRTDFVHQVAPFYLDEAMRGGEPAERHFMVPYGIKVLTEVPLDASEVKQIVRKRLGLPANRKVVLSVGWIAREHKRMHYVIEEIARLSRPRPFLQLLGAMDAASSKIVELGNRLLGPGNFSVRSVPYVQVPDFYRAADCFVLASLKEGFGRVYLEALMHGLPVIAHRHPVIEYVVGPLGTYGDLNVPEVLASLLQVELQREGDVTLAVARQASVRERFSWAVLAPQYMQMFRTASRGMALR